MRDQLLADYAAYTDPAGLISGQKNPTSSSGNAILFTAQYFWTLHKHGILINSITNDLYANLQKECVQQRGLLRRNSTNNDQEGPDDYVGYTSMGIIPANDVLEYGKQSFFRWGPFSFRYYYRNELPYTDRDVRAWLGRQPQLIAHFEFAANKKPPFWRRLWWAIAVSTTGLFGPPARKEGGQDTWTLSWLLVQTYLRHKQRYWYCTLATEIFYWRLHRVWPNGMKEVFAVYFNDPEHPHAKWFVDKL